MLISACKGEARNLRSGYKQLARHLKAARCDVRRLDAASGLTPAALAQAAIVVFGGPTQPFAPNELDCLRAYLRGGGNLLVLAGEGGEAAAGTNLNSLLADYGLRVAADCVIQTAFTRRAAAAAPAGRQPAKTAASYTAADGRLPLLFPSQPIDAQHTCHPEPGAHLLPLLLLPRLQVPAPQAGAGLGGHAVPRHGRLLCQQQPRSSPARRRGRRRRRGGGGRPRHRRERAPAGLLCLPQRLHGGGAGPRPALPVLGPGGAPLQHDNRCGGGAWAAAGSFALQPASCPAGAAIRQPAPGLPHATAITMPRQHCRTPRRPRCPAGAAWWQEGGGGSGRLAVLGSAAMFDDEWLAKEDNTALLDFLLGWMLRDPACELRPKNMAEPEIVDPRPVTHVAELAAKPLVCLQVGCLACSPRRQAAGWQDLGTGSHSWRASALRGARQAAGQPVGAGAGLLPCPLVSHNSPAPEHPHSCPTAHDPHPTCPPAPTCRSTMTCLATSPSCLPTSSSSWTCPSSRRWRRCGAPWAPRACCSGARCRCGGRPWRCPSRRCSPPSSRPPLPSRRPLHWSCSTWRRSWRGRW